MIPGATVLLRLPQPDLLPGKLRPALVLSELSGPFGDVLVCGISSQLRHEVPRWDERLTPAEPDFTTSGLKVASVIRLTWRAAVNPAEIEQISLKLGGQPQSHILLDVSRTEGSEQLAVEFASMCAERWPCVVYNLRDNVISATDVLRLRHAAMGFEA